MLGTKAIRRKYDAMQNSSEKTTKTYKVQLLVTRHGLSCANIAQKWVGNWDVGRGFIHDTLLSGAGESGSIEAARDVKRFLESHSLTVDAVLSSVLARAMQTAIYMFPEHADSAPVHVMPYIREIGRGLSNAPKSQAEQPAHLQSALGGKPLDLDYKWVNEFGFEQGSWEEFLHFLEQFFLPELVSKKGSDTTIVLPVVTHSNFMRDSLRKCSKAWTDKGADKPLNNQVVNMVYEFEARDEVPERDAENNTQATPSFFVLGSSYDTGKLNGAWVELEEKKSGKSQYAKLTDPQCKIQWSESRNSWRMFVDNAIGHIRPTLFQSDVDSDTLPLHGWREGEEDGVREKTRDLLGLSKTETFGTLPRFVMHNAKYKLKEADVPCDEVAPGLALKNESGNRGLLCSRDVGEQCKHAIRDHSWCAGCLSVAEDVLEEKTKQFDAARRSYLKSEKSFQDLSATLQETAKSPDNRKTLIVFDGPANVQTAEQIEKEADMVKQLQSDVQDMKRQQAILVKTQAAISAIATRTCLDGGLPTKPELGPRIFGKK